MTAEASGMRSHWRAVSVGVAFAVFYLLLRSQQYAAVDGAVRCLVVFHNHAAPLHGNNHMLYPFWIRLWTDAAGALGFTTNDWFSFMRLSQAMNACAAAASVGLLCWVLEVLAGARVAVLGAPVFGLSTALMLHATNAAEPVTGLFFSIAALWLLVVAVHAESNIAIFLVGVLLTLAMASYESMALTAVVVALGCVCWPGTTWRLAAKRLAFVCLGGVLSVITVYGLGYSSLGIPPRKMFRQFFVIADDQYYGGFSVSKLVNVPFGMLRNLFQAVPYDYQGIRHLLHGPHAAFWISIDLVSLALLAALGWLAVRGLAAAASQSPIWKPLVWAGIILSLLAVYFPVLYRGPVYDKMWLLPIAVTVIAIGVGFHFAGPRVQRWLTIGLVGLVIVEAGRNIPRAVGDHVHETAHMSDAREIAAMVHPGDAVMIDFDDVSQLWASIWGYGINIISLPASTRREAAEWLAQAETKESARDGAIYFVSVLDHDPAKWDAFLGHIMGIPYADFNCYRQKSAVVQQYSLDGELHTVRRLQPPFSCEALVAESQNSK